MVKTPTTNVGRLNQKYCLNREINVPVLLSNNTEYFFSYTLTKRTRLGLNNSLFYFYKFEKRSNTRHIEGTTLCTRDVTLSVSQKEP